METNSFFESFAVLVLFVGIIAACQIVQTIIITFNDIKRGNH